MTLKRNIGGEKEWSEDKEGLGGAGSGRERQGAAGKDGEGHGVREQEVP